MIYWIGSILTVLMTLSTQLKKALGTYPDFPKKGIIFKDLMPVFATPSLFTQLIDYFCCLEPVKSAEAIVGIDARGFILASPISYCLNKPFIPARKPGKLPGQLISKSYSLEYGSNELAIQEQSIEHYSSFVVIDDLLATGGTAKAVVDILKSKDKTVEGVCVVIELLALGGSRSITCPTHSLLSC